MNEETIQHINNDELLNKACELTATATQLKTFCRLLSMLEVARINKDKFAIHHEIETGFLGELRDNLLDASSKIQSISNDICPD